MAFARGAYLLMVVLLAARPLFYETYERVEFSFLEQMGVGSRLTPALTVTLDCLLMLSAAVLVALVPAPVIPGRKLWLPVLGAAGLLSAVVLSAAGANNERIALSAGGTLVAYMSAAFALLLRPPSDRMRTLLLAAILASGFAFGTRCWLQKLVEFPALKEDFAQRMSELPAEARERPEFINYQRRLASAEVYGYQTHPNIAGSCLLMWALPLSGVACAAIRDWRRLPGHSQLVGMVAGAGAPFLLMAMWWTGSMGALGSTLIATVLFALVWANLGPRRRREKRSSLRVRSAGKLFAGVVAAHVLLFAGTLIYGGTYDRLPTASMAFRWFYWSTAWRAYLAAPVTGIGRENFGAAYLQYKPVESTEEVKNAHDLWITLLTEMGPFGLLAGVLLVGAAAWYVFPRRVRSRESATDRGDAVHALAERIKPRPFDVALVTVGVLGLQAWASDGHFDNPGWVLLWSVELCCVWFVSFFVFVAGLGGILTQRVPAFIVQCSMAAGVIGVMFHNLVCFSLFTPAGLGLWVALVVAGGQLRAKRASREDAGAGGVSWRLPWLFGGGAIAHLALLCAPVVLSHRGLDEILNAIRNARSKHEIDAAVQSTRVALLDPLDPEPPRILAQTLARSIGAAGQPSEAIAILERSAVFAQLSADRSSHSVATAQLRADIRAAQARLASSADEKSRLLQRALAQRQTACNLSPTNPRLYVQLAQTAIELWLQTGNRELAIRARGALRQAEQLDEGRPAGDVVRLRPRERAEIQSLRSQLSE